MSATRTCPSWKSRIWSKRSSSRNFPQKATIEIVTTPTDDNRSYHINSDKIRACSASRQNTRSRKRYANCAGLPRRASSQSASATMVLQRPHPQEAQGRMIVPLAVVTGGAGIHRQPHGRSAARPRISRSASSTILSAAAQTISPITRPTADLTCTGRTSARSEPISPIFAACDYVFHFAGIGDIVPSIEQPTEYMDINVQGTVRVLECARHAKVAQIRLCGFVVLLRPRRDADARRSPDRAAISLCVVEISGRAGGLPLAQGLRLPVNSICIFNAYGTRVRTTGAYGACSACSSGRNSPASRSRWWATARRAATSSTRPTSPKPFLPPPRRTCRASASMSAPETHKRSIVWSKCSAATSFSPKRPGEPDCTFADIRKIRTSSRLGARRFPSKRASRGCWPRSTLAGRAAWDPDSIAQATRDLVPISRRQANADSEP